jgi:hypothetical protein
MQQQMMQRMQRSGSAAQPRPASRQTTVRVQAVAELERININARPKVLKIAVLVKQC